MPDNGKNGRSSWIRWLVAVLFTALFTAFTTLTSHVIANDDKSRTRDTKLKDEFVEVYREQAKISQQIFIKLAKMETDMVYIKKQLH